MPSHSAFLLRVAFRMLDAMRISTIALCVLLVSLANPVRGADGHSTNNLAAQELKKLQVAPGLKVELFASEPLLQNPVCFSIDGQGRFFVVETHRYRNAIFDITANTPWLFDDLSFRTVEDRAAFLARTFATNFAVLTNDSEIIRLVEDRNGDRRADDSRVFTDGFNKSVAGTAAGVLAQGTNVWFTCIPDLWRISKPVISRPVVSNTATAPARPSLNTGSLITESLATGLGVHISVSGHDVHGLIRGHDGRIYFSFGDRGVCVTNREGVVLNAPDTGGVLRCEPDGRNMEIFCTGLRNPQELAFDDYGNLWTVDNDTAGADPCRVLHLVEGGDYGWRASYQHMKGFGPWVQEELWRGGLDGILPPAGTVSQGPAGLAFYPGTSSTPQLAGKFVHADFPGGVWAYSVKPRGASYEIVDKEKILWNCWPTDVDFGPDGALYVLDWVQGWTPPGKGRIYCLTASGPSSIANSQSVQQTQRLLAEGMAKRSNKDLIDLLGHADRRVRLEAQWTLAESGMSALEPLSEIAEGSRLRLQRMHALWAIGQILRGVSPATTAREVEVAVFTLLHLVDDTDRLVAAQASGSLADAISFEMKEAIAPLLSDTDLAARLVAGHALARMPFGRTVRTQSRAVDKLAGLVNKPWAHRVAARLFPRRSNWAGPLQNAGSLLEGHETDPFLQTAAKLVLQQGVGMGSFYDDRLTQASTNRSRAIRRAALQAYRRLAERTIHQPVWPGFPQFQSSAVAHALVGTTGFLSDPEPRLVLEAVHAINDTPIAGAYLPLSRLLEDSRFRDPDWGWTALSNATPAGPFSAKVRSPCDQVLLRVLNAHYRLGTAESAEALVRFAVGMQTTNPAGIEAAADAPMPAHLRAEALFLLGAWEVLPARVGDLSIKPTKDPNHGSIPTVNPENWPGWFDRVVGLYRPLSPRSPDSARRALEPVIAALVADESAEVALAALEAAVKLRTSNAAPTLLVRLRDVNSPVSLRRRVPGALGVVGPDKLNEAVQVALIDSSAEVRASALPFLDRLDSNKAAEILGRIVAGEYGRGRTEVPADGQLALVQAALEVLGGLRNPAANTTLRAALTNLIESRLPSGLELDLLEASARRDDPDIKTLLVRYESTGSKTNGLGKWQAALHGGNAERGRTIFLEKAETQCSRCHQVKGEGGTVGPVLDNIAGQRSREILLEAIVLPNKAIASGFENVVLTLKNGSSPAGVVKSEDATSLRLDSPEDVAMTIAKSDIVERRRGLSAMPEEMAQQLSLRELRDLVEFLASLK